MVTKINGIEMPTDFGAALGDTVGAGLTPDWTKLINGCVLQMNWETPPRTPIQTAIAFSSAPSVRWF